MRIQFYKPKLMASVVHLLLSIIIISVFMWFVFNRWYPGPLFSASGGLQGLQIVFLVDIVLGPTLTFIVFNQSKEKWKLLSDLTIIFVIQITALAWGGHIIYNNRPVVISFWESEFFTVPANEYLNFYPNLNELYRFGDQLPIWVYSKKPVTPEGLQQLARDTINDKIAPHIRISLYESLSENFSEVVRHQQNIAEIISNNSEMKNELNRILSTNNKKITELNFIKLTSKYRNIILVFDSSASLIGYLSAPYKNTNEIYAVKK